LLRPFASVLRFGPPLRSSIASLLHFAPLLCSFASVLHFGPSLWSFTSVLHFGPSLRSFAPLLRSFVSLFRSFASVLRLGPSPRSFSLVLLFAQITDLKRKHTSLQRSQQRSGAIFPHKNNLVFDEWKRYVKTWASEAVKFLADQRHRNPLQILAIATEICVSSPCDSTEFVADQEPLKLTPNAKNKRRHRGLESLYNALGGPSKATTWLHSAVYKVDDLLAIFPEETLVMQSLKAQWILAAFDELQSCWSVEKCLYAVVKHRLPFQTWFAIVQTLFRVRNPDTPTS
jgi:hypothetical protein